MRRVCIGDEVKVSEAKNAIRWKVIGELPALPGTGGTLKYLLVKDKRRAHVTPSQIKEILT